MAQSMNLLPDDMQEKGFIPKIKPDGRVQVDGVKKLPVTETEVPKAPSAPSLTPFNNQEFLKEIAEPEKKEVENVPINKVEAISQKMPSWSDPVGEEVKKVETKKVETAVGNMPDSRLNNVAKNKKPIKFNIDWRKILNYFVQLKAGHEQEAFGINLVPREDDTLSYAKITQNIAIILIPAIVLVSGLYVIARTYSAYVKDRTEVLVSQLTTNIKISDADIEKLELNAAGLEKKATVMRSIIGRHIYWTNLLDYLEKIFISEVYIKSLTAENKGSIIINAQTNSYTAVAKQYIVLQMNPDIKSVSITGAGRETLDSPVNFSIRLDIWPYILYPNVISN